MNENNISMALGALVIIITGILVINYFRNLPTGTTLKPGATTETGVGKTHKVERGETLWSLSEKYYGTGYRWNEIAKANSLSTANQIEVGQELAIPETKEVIEPATPQPTTAGVEGIAGASYKVVRGDSLWTIAVRAYGDGYKWVNIARENKLVNPNLIHPGNTLTLPR